MWAPSGGEGQYTKRIVDMIAYYRAAIGLCDLIGIKHYTANRFEYLLVLSRGILQGIALEIRVESI